MKKVYLLLSLAILGFSAFSQNSSDLKPFKVDVSVGYAMPGGSGSKAGVLFAVEPKYAVISNLSIGLRMEGAVIARFNGYDAEGNLNDVSVKASGSYIVTGDYYFTDNYHVRPFAGIGGGIYTIAGAEANDDNSSNVSVGSKFGGMIRAGIELSHFRVGIEYNLVPKTTFTGNDSQGNPTTGLTSSNSYLGIKVGVCFGGGPRK
ncbi:MAG TPA: hypothetical protein VGI82_12395 [Chitinophagaceae bacterium]|jgi:outer membrane protein X